MPGVGTRDGETGGDGTELETESVEGWTGIGERIGSIVDGAMESGGGTPEDKSISCRDV